MGLYSNARAYVAGAVIGAIVAINGIAIAETYYPEQTKMLFSRVTGCLAEEYRLAKKAVGFVKKTVGCENNEQLEKTEQPDKMLELEKRIDALEKRESNESK